MREIVKPLKRLQSGFESDELKEAQRFFEWAFSYERKGLKAAAEALKAEGRDALERFLQLRCAKPNMKQQPSQRGA